MLRTTVTSTLVQKSSLASGTVAAAAATATAFAARRHTGGGLSVRGRCEYRLSTSHTSKRGPEALKDLKEADAKRAVREPKSKKEALAHLADHEMSFEKKSCLQRQADDMMAIYSDPRDWCGSMSYQYHRVGKHWNGAGTWINETSSCGELIKMKNTQ